jgi:essential recombination function protein|uniref:ERF superfamily protein n=1 Tax=Siphoviridae sp. ct6rT12 TaxID=2825346 RepID=A0A8S5V9N5_9CAUD|nr:MAG TPA: ERF superfamily protein [Siphoviridae sp. ct6rT12]
MNIYEKLLNVQIELKAPKNQFNKFGGFKYRSCEDILEALKPVLSKYKLAMIITDDIITVNNRNYVKATVRLFNTEKEEFIENSAIAREEESKKGMDGSQITGASSSYARKYALNGLFAIDDTKDSDSTNTYDGVEKKSKVQEYLNSRPGMVERLTEYLTGENLERTLNHFGVKEINEMTDEQLQEATKKIFKK